MKRQHNPSAPAPILLFYAPLTQNKEAVYAHDGILNTFYNGNNYIKDGELYNPFNTSTCRTLWSTSIPQNKNLTFNCFVTCKQYVSGINCMHGFSRLNPTMYSGLFLAKYPNNNSNEISADYIIFHRANDLLTIINEKHFITWTIIFNENASYTIKLYKNGVFHTQSTIHSTEWLGVTAEDKLSIGLYGNNNTIGYFSHFSVFEELSEIQIKTIYENGGIVTIP